jgi:hypothetical protein
VGDDEAEKAGTEARFNGSRVVRSDFTGQAPGCTEEPGYLIRLSFLMRPIQLAPPGLVQKSLIVFILPRARQKKSRPDIRRLVNKPGQNYNKWCGGFSSFPVFGPVLDGAAGFVPLPPRRALR